MIRNLHYVLHLPAVLRPGLAVNLATSTIFTANCCFDSRCMHRRTIENGPLQKINETEKLMIQFFGCYFFDI